MKFSIIIPNYNSEKYIEKCINSVLSQTYKNFNLIIIDDCSTDNSINIIKKFLDQYNIYFIQNETKRYNGGSRNVGIEFAKKLKTDYTLFLDNDDWFSDNYCLEEIVNIILKNNNPDCISLSYNCLLKEGEFFQPLIRNNIVDLVNSIFVAAWTKCIKTDLLEPFPENTLMEDVSQHIKQCDILNTIVSCEKPIIVWNRLNENSCSLNPNKKRKSSEWRQIADIMDLELIHDYCIEQKEYRIQRMKETLFSGNHLY